MSLLLQTPLPPISVARKHSAPAAKWLHGRRCASRARLPMLTVPGQRRQLSSATCANGHHTTPRATATQQVLGALCLRAHARSLVPCGTASRGQIASLVKWHGLPAFVPASEQQITSGGKHILRRSAGASSSAPGLLKESGSTPGGCWFDDVCEWKAVNEIIGVLASVRCASNIGEALFKGYSPARRRPSTSPGKRCRSCHRRSGCSRVHGPPGS
mmetsp:Transcript_16220/g.50940  ORF Transcript_16220/g.50940 Transcript_16220/m.50940 type:complete len:215 (-) Transcript_16220:967-1611(-)